ncbi:Hsp20/alpha crystallin family protein [uncultured Microscilla sp.]|uniref:Hsp20/alpha crystallin family protein n=1 Tax=uncultured Microscilla sp. TaxID=432653 RepID=UPI002629E61F|nr:Hsp20/alpha crystallin family protein [uncultured Microscilla sp.]
MEDNMQTNKVTIEKGLLKSIAQDVRALNTVAGGIVATQMKIIQSEDGYTVKIKAPTVPIEAYNIEINRDQLMIYTTLAEDASSEDIITPFFQVLPISSGVNVEAIEAVFENGELQIFAPFYEEHKSSKIKRINIRQI